MHAAKKELGVVKQVRIADIVVPEGRKRSVRRLGELTRSIAALGLLNPIVITRDRRLVAGLHRLRACEALGWKEISAVALGLSEIDAELAEIDENLCRTELTPLERAEQTTRRKALHEARHPETRRGVAGAKASNRHQGKGDTTATVAVASFVDDTASKTGASARAIARDAQIAEGIAPSVRQAIRDTPLAGRMRELVELARVTDAELQAQVADLIVSGEVKSVAEALKQLKGGGGRAAPSEPAVICDQLGQKITDPEIAEAFTLLGGRLHDVVGLLRQGAKAWGSHFHQELVDAGKVRLVEARAYMGTRRMAEDDLPHLTSLLVGRLPYALCPYCKGAPLPRERKKYCEGCGGGGWVDRLSYDAAPPELKLPGNGRQSRRRAGTTAEVGHE